MLNSNFRIATGITAAAILLVAGLLAGCGPSKTVVTTPMPSAAGNAGSTPSTGSVSVIMPEESAPPLPGVMTSGSPSTTAGSSGDGSDSANASSDDEAAQGK